MSENLWKIGRVKFFDDNKGFGFVNCWEDQNDYFIHISRVEDGPVTDKDLVVFKIIPSRKKPGTMEATKLSLFSMFEFGIEFLSELFFQYEDEYLRKEIIKRLPVDVSLKLIEKELRDYKSIETEEQYSNFINKANQISSLFEQKALRDGVREIIGAWAHRIADSKYCVKFWLDNIISEIPNFAEIENYFKNANDLARKEILIRIPVEAALMLIEIQLSSFAIIETVEQYNSFKIQIQQIISLLGQKIPKDEIQEIINKLVNSIVNENLRVTLWIDHIISLTPEFSKIENFFLIASNALRIEIFTRLNESEKLSLLLSLINHDRPEQAIDFVLGYLRKKNNLGNYLDLKSKLFDTTYWENISENELITETINYFESSFDQKKLLELFFNGYYPTFSVDYVFQILSELSKAQIETILASKKISVPEIQKMLGTLIRDNCTAEKDSNGVYLSWIYRLAKQTLDENSFGNFDNETIQHLSEELHFIIWEIGQSKVPPLKYIAKFILDNENLQSILKDWISKKRLTKEEAVELLEGNIKQLDKILNRKQFYVIYFHLEALSDFIVEESKILPLIKEDNIWFYKLVRWITGESDVFDFDEFKSLLVYLSPAHQVKFLKKIFWLKHIGKFDLTIEKLNQLTRIDFDIYKLNQEFHPDILLDITVDVVIEAIKSFKTQGKFLFDSDLIKIVIKDVSLNLKHKFEIGGLFEKCKGRYEAKFNWQHNGEISKLDNGWQISFEYDSGLVDEVKKLPHRSYNTQNKNWFVPLNEEKAVYNFAKQFRFLIHKSDGNNYSNNTHLAEWKRTKIPNGIKYCEGRLANNDDQLFKCQFWWCCNEKCFKNCEADHTDLNYKAEPDIKENIYFDNNDLPF